MRIETETIFHNLRASHTDHLKIPIMHPSTVLITFLLLALTQLGLSTPFTPDPLAHREAAATTDISLIPRTDTEATSLARRNKTPPPICNVDGFSFASVWRIQQGVSYLNGQGRCSVNAKTCARVSCSWDSAIYLCNDNDYYIEPACPYIASYAADIINTCQYYYAKRWVVTGQEFDSDGYNVVVRGDSC